MTVGRRRVMMKRRKLTEQSNKRAKEMPDCRIFDAI